MKKVSIITAEEAALKVQDGDTIATGGFVSCACPETLSKALEKRFLETGHPQNLTLFFAAGQATAMAPAVTITAMKAWLSALSAATGTVLRSSASWL